MPGTNEATACFRAVVRRKPTIDPHADVAAAAVLAALEAAHRAGLPSVKCYRAAVEHGGALIPISPPNTPPGRRWR